MMLAQQQLDGIPPGFWKYFCIAMLVLLAVAGAVIFIIVSFRKPAPTRLSDDPPIEVRKAPKRFNHDLSEARHEEVSSRLNAHDAELDQLWTVMRSEDKDIREKSADRFEKIAAALGRIEGSLGTHPQGPK